MRGRICRFPDGLWWTRWIQIGEVFFALGVRRSLVATGGQDNNETSKTSNIDTSKTQDTPTKKKANKHKLHQWFQSLPSTSSLPRPSLTPTSLSRTGICTSTRDPSVLPHSRRATSLPLPFCLSLLFLFAWKEQSFPPNTLPCELPNHLKTTSQHTTSDQISSTNQSPQRTHLTNPQHLLPHKRQAKMCYRKLFIHHRCGHKITELVEACGNVECRTVYDTTIISNKYTCVIMSCIYYGHF